MRFTILASGSGGNCSYIETGTTRILVDAGLSGRQISTRLQTIGRDIPDIQGILVTHEHSDHTMGLNILGKRKKIPIYCNRLTSDALKPELGDYNEWRIFRTGDNFMIGDIYVETFPVPHDAYDPCCYTISHGGSKIGFLTDLGHATRLVVEKVRSCTALVIEANYDLSLLRADTHRPWAVKQRILARHGHLSNEAAAEVVAQVVTDKLRHIYLGHLSEDCNRPELAKKVIVDKLTSLGVTHVEVYSTSQRECSPTLDLNRPLTH